MKEISFKLNPLYVAVALGLSTVSATHAQNVLEEVIVTGVPRATTKLESTASVTSLSAEELFDSAPRSTAEVFRNIPGIHAEASSGDANSNIKVRGMPISAGGSRYLSIQEDGFPVLLVGDAAFASREDDDPNDGQQDDPRDSGDPLAPSGRRQPQSCHLRRKVHHIFSASRTIDGLSDEFENL